MLSRQSRFHAAGALLVVLMALFTEALIMGGGLYNPGVRATVFLSGLLVTMALLLRDIRDALIGGYVVAFVASFLLFALLGV